MVILNNILQHVFFFCAVDALHLLFCFQENICEEYSHYVVLKVQSLIFTRIKLFEDGFWCSSAIAEWLF